MARNMSWMMGLVMTVLPVLAQAGELTMYFAPEWKEKAAKAKEITDVLSQASGLTIQPRVVGANPDLITAFEKSDPAIVYVGSLITTLLTARGLGTPLAQGVKEGKESYSAVLVAPVAAGSDPAAIVSGAGEAISYAKGASSGELGAKAASNGKANVAANNHAGALNAVKAGKAKAAFVKNWWWEEHKGEYADFQKFDYPGVSEHHNADFVLSVNKGVAEADRAKVKQAASAHAAAFGVTSFRDFDPAATEPTKALMKKGNLDPATYTW